MNLYVLKCTNGKYYIGTTKLKPEVRLAQHLRGSGSSWTKKYKPLWILETKQKCAMVIFNRISWMEYWSLFAWNLSRGT